MVKSLRYYQKFILVVVFWIPQLILIERSEPFLIIMADWP